MNAASSRSVCCSWRLTRRHGAAPQLRALSRLSSVEAEEPGLADILTRPECGWIGRDLEGKAQAHAIAKVVPEHLAEVRERKIASLDKTEAAVKERLTKEINYWDFRAEQLKDQERAGKANARLNSGEARKRADDLQARLQRRLEEITGTSAVPAAAGRPGRCAGRARGPSRRHTGRPSRGSWRLIHKRGRRAPRHRHGDRARIRLRAGRPRVGEARL